MAVYRARYRRWPSRYGRGTIPRPVLLGVAAGIALAAAGGSAAAQHHHHHRHSVPISAAPAAIAWSRPAWAKALLRGIPEPVTTCNLNAVVAWEAAEGGGFGNQASFDPLNLNPPPGTPWPGHAAIGAWAFPDARTGVAYTVRTVRGYGGILAALAAGNDAQAVCDAIVASPWAQSHYYGQLTASC